MDSQLMDRLRKELEADRANAIAELERHGAEPYSEKIAPMEGIDDNFADSAAATAERAEILALIETTRERLAAADNALARMEEGTYGRCERCGQQINEARLEARPLSVRCVECAKAG